MVSLQTTAGIIIKVLKLIVNVIILDLYRTGSNSGQFLGTMADWYLNEERKPSAEIFASGVFVGFLIYTTVVLITYCFGTLEHKKTLVEIAMNIAGMFGFMIVGAMALHYWLGYMNEHKHIHISNEKMNGIILGSLCIVQAALFLVDLIFTFLHFMKYLDYE